LEKNDLIKYFTNMGVAGEKNVGGEGAARFKGK